jgi:hypothetical protein
VLADLRPNVDARADFAQWQIAQGVPTHDLMEPTRRVSETWREQHALLEVELLREGPLPDIDDVELRQELERTHAELLKAHGMRHLDISDIRSRNRAVTQRHARSSQRRDIALRGPR